MLRVSNVRVYDLKESVIASRNAKRLLPPEYTDEEFEKSLKRATQLANAPSGSGHQTWLSGVRVSFDLVYPNYISPELQRYHWIDIVTSSSKMHRLLEMRLEDACNKYVSTSAINTLQYYIDIYNMLDNEWEDGASWSYELRSGEIITANTKQDALYYAFMLCVSNCPQGIELFMRVSTNYLQLKTIYAQRKHHKLKEDWGAFCDFVRALPYSKEFITNGE